MSMFGPREGSWDICSESDPRWNASGRAMVGGFNKPNEADQAIRDKEKILGKPPEDLEWGYFKD